MAKTHAKVSDFTFNSVALEGSLSGITLNIEQNDAEVTSLNEAADTYLEGQYGWTEDIDGFWDPAVGGIDATLFARIGNGSATSNYTPGGGSPGAVNPLYTGSAFLKTLKISSSVKDAVKISASLQGTGAIARTVT